MIRSRRTSAVVAAILSFLLTGDRTPQVHAQTTPPRWSGIAADDARPSAGAGGFDPFATTLAPHALSGDARFIVFTSALSLEPGDTNDLPDVYLRDRQTHELVRVSSTPGGNADGPSFAPAMSHDGRYVVFASAASNLVAGDFNGQPDAFVYDRVQRHTIRVSLGALDEESLTDAGVPSISADGRYVAFQAMFTPAPSGATWIRDRDIDGNGIFDESGLTSVTVLPDLSAGDGERLFSSGPRRLSPDGRYVAYTPSVYTSNFEYLGTRLYLFDRTAGTFSLIGAASTDPAQPIEVVDPDLGAAVLVYASNAPNLTPGDTGLDMDVFAVELSTGNHTRLQITHPGAPVLVDVRGPAISSDDRFVTFVGLETNAVGGAFGNVYVVDLTTHESFDVSLLPDGTRVDAVGDYPSINSDGSAIAFVSAPGMLIDGAGNFGVFVATGLGLTPAAVTIDSDGGSATLSVAAPATTGWETAVREFADQAGQLQLSSTAGVGDGTIDVSLPPNRSGLTRSYWVIVGSERVVVTQPSGPELHYLSPAEGPSAGGTEVTIVGNGFTGNTAVSFGGLPALSVVVDSAAVVRAVTPPGAAGSVDVVVETGGGESATLTGGFTYLGDSRLDVPLAIGNYGGATVLRATLTSLGTPQAGRSLSFFIGNAAVGQAVTDVAGEAHLPFALGSLRAGSVDFRVEFAGDATVPATTAAGLIRVVPVPLVIRARDSHKVFGQALPAFAVDTTGFVNGESVSALNGTLSFDTTATATSAPGVYHVTPGGVWSLNYDITVVPGVLTVYKAFTALTVTSTPNPSRHRARVQLRAGLAAVAPGAGLPTGQIVFRDNGSVIGTVAAVNGVAVLDVAFRQGVHVVTAGYAGDTSFVGTVGALVHVVK